MDWDPADIVAALRKEGWSLRRLSFANGYRTNAVKHALRRPYPQAERIIAGALQRDPAEIWPSRYGPFGGVGAQTSPAELTTCTHGDNWVKDTTLQERANAGADDSE